MASSGSADVVIVGSGVAGSLVAHQLASAGASVIVLEAGPRIARWQIVENFRDSPAKADFASPYPSAALCAASDAFARQQLSDQQGRAALRRAISALVGGTTWHWAAAAWRMLPADFRMRTLYGVGRDWPFPYETLEPWYYAAEVQLGVSGPGERDRSRLAAREAVSDGHAPALLDGPAFLRRAQRGGVSASCRNRSRATAVRTTRGPPAAATTTACRSVRSPRCTTASRTPRRPSGRARN